MNNKTKMNTPRFLRSLLGAAVLAAGLGLVTTTASANAILVGSVTGVPSGANQYQDFNSLTVGDSTSALLAGGLTVSFTGQGNAVQGATSGVYAEPVLSADSGANFGGQANGADTTIFLSTGGADSSVTLSFTQQQKYLGLLWGSVDAGNELTFYNGNTQVAQFSGTDVGTSAGAGSCSDGNQAAQGTCYVNINFLAGYSFDRVVATSENPSFEFDNVAFSTAPVGVPEPRILAMFGLGLLLVGSAYRFKGRRQA